MLHGMATPARAGSITPRGGAVTPHGGTVTPRGGTVTPHAGAVTPRSSTTCTPHDMPPAITSPISIQSPFGGSRVSKSSGTESHPKATPTLNESSYLQSDPHTMPVNSDEKWEGHRERRGNKERRVMKTGGSSQQEGRGSSGRKHAEGGGGGSQRRTRSQDDTPSVSKLEGVGSEGGVPLRGGMSRDESVHSAEQEDRLFSSPRLVSKGSPRLRRRQSREELSGPNPDSTHHHHHHRRGRGQVEDRSLQVSRSSRVGGAGLTRGSEGSRKANRSPEIVDDVSSSSLSTGSFDMSIQLLDISSPPQIILKAMENPE